MKILHLADLHLGKKVNDFSMLEEQEFVLNEAIELIQDEKIEAVLIAGDVFDRAIAPNGAIELFSSFLSKLNTLKVKVCITAGNHDNHERLAYLSSLLKDCNIFISKPYEGVIEKVELNDSINIYLMPYLYPALIRKYYPDSTIENYNDAIKTVVDDIELDNEKINIILAHQFVIGKNQAITSDSEQKSVGTIEEIDWHIFEKFDYTALGHLHCPQKIAMDNIYYAGSILKYSFSEINQKKEFRILDVQSKNNILKKNIPIKFKREMKEYKGYIEEFLSEKFYSKINTDDYIRFILLDENVLDAKKKLLTIYPNIMLLEFDNSFTRSLDFSFKSDISSSKTIYEHFCDFYELQTGLELDEDKEKIVKNTFDSIKAGDVCAH